MSPHSCAAPVADGIQAPPTPVGRRPCVCREGETRGLSVSSVVHGFNSNTQEAEAPVTLRSV